jgi:NAD(P)-dependent dehydrogenase (short-subunit alcohol dehydrogenase family)
VQRLLGAGWQVTALSRSAPPLQHAALQHRPIDLLDGNALAALAPQLGTPQALVHAAGVLRPGHLGDLQPGHGQQMWQLHVQAATVLANVLLPRMAQAGWGRVVLLGSRVADGMAGRSQYAASKAALRALARSWAAEVVAQGVTVNLVSPAATDTPMLVDPARQGSAVKPLPLGRLIQPGEVASLVGYLLSEEAAAITGQEVVVCGGASLGR